MPRKPVPATKTAQNVPPIPAEVKPISPEEFDILLAKLGRPYLEELIMKDIELAMGNGKEAAKARQDFYDRMVGPKKAQETTVMPLAFTIKLERIEPEPRSVAVPGQTVDSPQVRVLPAPKSENVSN